MTVISALPAASALSTEDTVEVQGATTVRDSVADIAALARVAFSTSSAGMIPAPPAMAAQTNQIISASGQWVSY